MKAFDINIGAESCVQKFENNELNITINCNGIPGAFIDIKLRGYDKAFDMRHLEVFEKTSNLFFFLKFLFLMFEMDVRLRNETN